MEDSISKSPQLSIVIPVLNGMPFIAELIEGLLQIDSIDFNIFVSDNQSDDGTTEFLQGLKDTRLTHSVTSTRITAAENWNRASVGSSGRYTKLVCADDLVTEGGLMRQISAALQYPEIGLIASRRFVVNESGKVILRKHGLVRMKGVLNGDDAIRRSILTGTNQFGEPASILFRTDAFKNALPWDSTFPYLTDLDFYCRVLSENRFLGLSTVDAGFRLSRNSWSNRIGNLQAKQFSDWLDHFSKQNMKIVSRFTIYLAKTNANLLSRIRILINRFSN